MFLIDKSKEKLLATLEMAIDKLAIIGMEANRKKSIVQRSDYGISFLG